MRYTVAKDKILMNIELKRCYGIIPQQQHGEHEENTE
jgi:hypothetical protein